MATQVLILTAVKFEARLIVRELNLSFGSDGLSGKANDGRLIVLQVAGVRANRLSKLSPPQDGCVIMAGLAGGLDPSLRAGDVVLDERSDCVFRDFRTGRIHTAGEIVSTVEEKARLFRDTNALAVDMENEIVHRWTKAAGRRFIGLRAISDTADEVLNPAVLAFVDDVGQTKPLSVAKGILRQPSLIPSLQRLGKNSALAAKNLAAAVKKIVEIELNRAPGVDG